MKILKEEGGGNSLIYGTIRLITKRGEIVMEKSSIEIRPGNKPTENAMHLPKHEQHSANKQSITIKPPKKN